MQHVGVVGVVAGIMLVVLACTGGGIRAALSVGDDCPGPGMPNISIVELVAVGHGCGRGRKQISPTQMVPLQKSGITLAPSFSLVVCLTGLTGNKGRRSLQKSKLNKNTQ